MAIEFKNGAVVSRAFDDGSGELLASFQYFPDAVTWAKSKSEKDEESDMGSIIIATCLHSGKSRVFASPLVAALRDEGFK